LKPTTIIRPGKNSPKANEPPGAKVIFSYESGSGEGKFGRRDCRFIPYSGRPATLNHGRLEVKRPEEGQILGRSQKEMRIRKSKKGKKERQTFPFGGGDNFGWGRGKIISTEYSGLEVRLTLVHETYVKRGGIFILE